MNTIIYNSYEELSVRTAELIAGIIEKKPDALLCFPAGETSAGTFRHLIGLNKSGKVTFKDCKIVGLDEWLGLGEMSNENCLAFLRKHFFDHIDYSKENLCFFDGESRNPDNEGLKTDNFIKLYGPIDILLLGAGMNGHLGLNEPGTPFNLYSHIVALDETTRRVGRKYFTREVDLRSGITLGLRHVFEAKTVILQLNGTKKAEIVKRIINDEVSPEFPASIVRTLKNSYLIIDRSAALLL